MFSTRVSHRSSPPLSSSLPSPPKKQERFSRSRPSKYRTAEDRVMPEANIVKKSQVQFLHLTVVEIAFRNKRPKYPIKIKLVQSSKSTEPRRKEFAKGNGEASLVWDIDLHVAPDTGLEVVVKESHTVKVFSKKEFASVKFEWKEIDQRDFVEKGDSSGLVSVKLSFSPSSVAGEVVLKAVSDAEKLLEKKPIALEKLGRARQFIEVAKNFGDMVSEIHPAAKAAVIAFDILYEKLKQQEEIHDDAATLLEDMQLFLPFTEVISPEKMGNKSAKVAIRDFLVLFKETCDFIVRYSSSGVIGDLISSQASTIEQLEKGFKKVKSRYDWSIKTDVWRSTLKLEKFHDDEVLSLLQASVIAPGKERQRSDKCCLPGTRTSLLQEISHWAESDSESKLFWLYGIAGSGKSSIANTVACDFDDQRLLAGCFFCMRDDPDLRNTDKVIPSLAFHLSEWHHPYSVKLLEILQGGERNKLASKTVQEQFDLLIKGPALELALDEQIRSPRPLVIVIDALDECGVTKGQRSHLAQVLVQLAQLVPWLKLVVTSRPLPELIQAFQGAGSALKQLHLNEAGDPTADIMLYTKHRANLVAQEFSLEPTWLSEEQAVALTHKAHGLFIWTSTVFNFIEGQDDVDHAVGVVFSSSSGLEDENPEAALDNIYRMVLQEAGKGSPHNMLLVKTVASIVFCTARNVPLPVGAISKLIPQFKEAVIGRVINQLQAVLYKDIELQNAIRVCHPSFIDFMSLETRAAEFWTQPSDIDLKLASRCLEIMKEGLTFNICGIESSYLANQDIPDLQRRVATEISKALSYSCLYWMAHVQGADVSKQEELSELIAGLLCNEAALYWLEVLSLLGELKKGIQMLSQASIALENPDLKAVALDLFRFVSAFHDAMATSTPHLYLSAIAWLPTDCLVVERIATKFNAQKLIRQGKRERWPTTLLTVQESSLVRRVAYSKDGLRIASGLQDGSITIRDSQTGTLIGPPLRSFAGMITSIAFSPDDKLIAGSTRENVIQIWDVETGVPTIGTIRLESFASSIAFTPDGRCLISGSNDGTIHFWDVETGVMIKDPIKSKGGDIRAIAVSPVDGRYIASCSEMGFIQIWNSKTGEPVGQPFEGHTNWVVALAYSPDGKYIISGSFDKTIRVWNAATGELVSGPCVGHTDYVASVAVSPRGDLVISASHDRTIRVWDIKTGKQIGRPLRGHTNWVVGIAFCPDGKHFASGSNDRSLRTWELEVDDHGEELLHGQVRTVAVSRDGKRIASGFTDNVIQLWDAETNKPIGPPFKGHTRWVNSVAFSNDGTRLASGSDDATVRIWDAQSHEAVGEPLTGHTGWVKSIDFSSDGRRLVSGSQDKTVRIWDVEKQKQLGLAFSENTDWVNTVSFCPDDTHVAAGADDSSILIYDTETGEMVGEPLAGAGAPVLSVAYSPDANYLAAGFADGSIRIWNEITPGLRIVVFDYTGADERVWSVAFSPDSRYLASGSEGAPSGVVAIWDVWRGEAVGAPLVGHTARVTSVAYAPDGSFVVSGSEDGTIRIWETESRPAPRIGIADVDGVPPSFIPEDGWIRSSGGELLLWVPIEYRNGVIDMSSSCIPPDALDHLVKVDWERLHHGHTWTKIRDW